MTKGLRVAPEAGELVNANAEIIGRSGDRHWPCSKCPPRIVSSGYDFAFNSSASVLVPENAMIHAITTNTGFVSQYGSDKIATSK